MQLAPMLARSGTSSWLSSAQVPRQSGQGHAALFCRREKQQKQMTAGHKHRQQQ
jgi:hypothetical protein